MHKIIVCNNSIKKEAFNIFLKDINLEKKNLQLKISHGHVVHIDLVFD